MTPEPNAASIAIFRADEVLLIQRALEPFAGFWTLPGGRLEPGESAVECAVREIREELGLRLDGVVPVTALAAGTAFTLMVYAAHMPAQQMRPSAEIADWQWVAPEAVGQLQTTPGLLAVLHAAWEKLVRVGP